jgi:hypothetical protein
MAKWPQLILPQFCTTEIEVVVESEDLNENGTPKQLLSWKGKCNYQDKSKRVWSAEKELTEVSGTCLIPGDIAPDMLVIPSGTVAIYGVKRELVIGTKARNPDGTVNYTRLELR